MGRDDLARLTVPFAAPDRPLDFNAEVLDAVILLDEIDKAEPDLPNDLLEPLDRLCFQIPDGPRVAAVPDLKLLVVITTNGERELPPAFLRRCVSLVLDEPGLDLLTTIAARHYPDGDPDLFRDVAAKVIEHREAARHSGQRPPSTSEYLDALRACARLRIAPGHPLWDRVSLATLAKEIGMDADAPVD